MDLKALWAALPRALKIYLAAVGVVGVAGVAGVTAAAAASPTPSPTASPSKGQAYCDSYTGHVASNLGKTRSQVQKAMSDAVGQTLADAVKNGDLTQKQADAIKARVGSKSCPAGVPGLGGARAGGPGRGFPRVAAAGLGEYAKALGISDSELRQDLQSGKTIKDVAASKGMDEAAFRTKLVGVTKADLDARGKSGDLTQKQEDAVIQRLQNGPLPLWDRPLPQRGRGPAGAGKQPGATAPAPSPSASPTP